MQVHIILVFNRKSLFLKYCFYQKSALDMQITTYVDFLEFLLDFVLNLLCYSSAHSYSPVQNHPVLLLSLPWLHFFLNTERKHRWKIFCKSLWSPLYSSELRGNMLLTAFVSMHPHNPESCIPEPIATCVSFQWSEVVAAWGCVKRNHHHRCILPISVYKGL